MSPLFVAVTGAWIAFLAGVVGALIWLARRDRAAEAAEAAVWDDALLEPPGGYIGRRRAPGEASAARWEPAHTARAARHHGRHRLGDRRWPLNLLTDTGEISADALFGGRHADLVGSAR
jgi:hypothetical protein